MNLTPETKQKIRLAYKAAGILIALRRLYEETVEGGDFGADVVEPLKKTGRINGDELVNQMPKDTTDLETAAMSLFTIASAYCEQVTAAAKAGDVEEAWLFLMEAKYWHGILNGREWGMAEALHDSASVDAAAAVQATLERIRRAASEGGRLSGKSRREKSAVPLPAALRAERTRLIAAGKSERNTAAILAERYGKTAGYIRKELKKSD